MDAVVHSKPWINPADIQSVGRVLESGMLAQGALTRSLELRIAAWLGAGDGVAAGSGSAALVLALHGIGAGPGDEIILPSYVCPSVYEAVLSAGAVPVLCDVGPDWVMTRETVRSVMTTRSKAAIVPHMYGIFAPVGEILELGLFVIEDCAQAFPAEGERKSPAQIQVASFHPTKCLTSSEGGMAVASDPGIVSRMRELRDGASDKLRARLLSPLSDLAAALAMSQLDRYPQSLQLRKSIAGRYRDAVHAALPGSLNPALHASSMHFRFPLRIRGGLDACAGDFLGRGIHVRRGVDRLLHRLAGKPDDAFPNSVRHFNTTVSIPIYPALTEGEQQLCLKAIADLLPLYQSA